MPTQLLESNTFNTFKKILFFCGLLLGSTLISFLIGKGGAAVGAIIIILLICIPLLLVTMFDSEFGFLILVWYSFFLFLIGRLLPVRLPVGIGVEVIEIILLTGILISELKNKNRDWSYFNTPITYIFFAFQLYNILQVFNPNATSIGAWLMASRGIVFELITYFIVVKLFNNLSFLVKFTKLWLFIALLAALYSFYQEIFGYQDFEWRDINSTPGGLSLIQNWGILRKFSFLSDVAAFGILMAFTGVFSFILATGPFSPAKRLILILSSIAMLVGMSFSGTRTATVIIPLGFFIWILMNLNKKSSLIILVVGTLGFGTIMFGPFYGGIVTRIRSAFQPKEDASMNVREYNRKRVQPYIYSHPIGGGLFTTDTEGEVYSPGHPLAGFATDGGFLKTALTTGWIGLLLLMTLYLTILITGINNYYKAKNPLIKSLYGAYIAIFFCLLIANYAQSAMGQKPTGIMVFAIFAIMPNLIKFDKE